MPAAVTVMTFFGICMAFLRTCVGVVVRGSRMISGR